MDQRPCGQPSSSRGTSTHLQKKIGDLARKSRLSDPHTPVWVSGLHYPVQYMVRETRSMSIAPQQRPGSEKTDKERKLIVSIPRKNLRSSSNKGCSLLPPISKLPQPLDFFLPDETFWQRKLEKLREVEVVKLTKVEDAITSHHIGRTAIKRSGPITKDSSTGITGVVVQSVSSAIKRSRPLAKDSSTGITGVVVQSVSSAIKRSRPITKDSSTGITGAHSVSSAIKRSGPLAKDSSTGVTGAHSVSSAIKRSGPLAKDSSTGITDVAVQSVSSVSNNTTNISSPSSSSLSDEVTSDSTYVCSGTMGCANSAYPLVNGYRYAGCIPAVNNNNNNNGNTTTIITWRAVWTEEGFVLACLSQTEIRLYHELKLLYSLEILLDQWLSLELLHDANNGSLFLCLGNAHQWSCWVFSLELPPMEMLTDPVDRRCSDIQEWVLAALTNQDDVIISFSSGCCCSVKTVRLSNSTDGWGVVLRGVLPHSDKIQSITSVEGDSNLLVGVANLNLLLWDVPSSSLLGSSSLICRSLSRDFPQLYLMKSFKDSADCGNGSLVFVLLCMTSPSPSNGAIAWLVAMDTSGGDCILVLRYCRPSTGTSSDMNLSVLDFCYHGNQHFTLLFSDGYLTSWSIHNSQPITNVLIESTGGESSSDYQGYCSVYHCDRGLLLGARPSTDQSQCGSSSMVHLLYPSL